MHMFFIAYLLACLYKKGNEVKNINTYIYDFLYFVFEVAVFASSFEFLWKIAFV